MVQTTFSNTVSSCPAEWWPTFFHTVMKIRFQKHTLRADSWSHRREMKTTLCTADDHCHLSSFQVSSSGSTHWLNRGKCAGWHSSSNYHRLTCYHRNKQSSVLVIPILIASMWSEDFCLSTNLSFFSIVWFHALLPVRASLRRQPPVLTSICWWIATQRLLRSVWDKSPQFLQTAL